ncbi:MAG: glycoside hydrolase family 5 protein [Fibromonadaceae bacterium]|jgi:endoglucanase|nr:glycoside hydrolase family 5 protein [Fibromonadaceae bacterium]
MKNIVTILVFACAQLWAQTDPLTMTTAQVVKDMGLGINIGNTMEARIVCDPGDSGCENWVNGMETLETSWGSPEITNAIVKGYADAGFKTVRIPVAWSNRMTGDNAGGTYTINPALMNRVEQIVNYVLGNGMYAIVNIHWDGGWWEKFPTDSAECMKKYIRIWEQITAKFKDKSGYLVFESLNEEGVWQSVWNQYDNSGNKDRAYGLLNSINQKFTDLVRASGGNNGERHLLIAGYATNIDRTIDPLFKMPTDSKNRQAVSVHYYDPFGFTHINEDGEWTDFIGTWGTPADINALNNEMDKMKTTFVDNDIPVIIGEYGFAAKLNDSRGRTQAQVRNYTLKVAEAIYTRDMCPVLWDVQLNPDNGEVIYYYNRKSTPPAFTDQQLVAGFKNIVGEDGETPTLNDHPADVRQRVSSAWASQLVSYYTIKGVPLGNVKPQKAGVYIVKQGNSVKKIAVK